MLQSKIQTNESMSHTLNIARQSGSAITTSTILRAAWALVIARYSDLNDVVFGTTVSGRNAPVPGVEKMLGPTIATLPVRVRLDSYQTVLQFLEDIQKQSNSMIPYEQ